VQTHRADEPEGRLLAYYAATLVYTPLGTLPAGRWWSLGVEATYLPTLSESQRRPGIDKPETTNLSPVLPRPRLAIRTPLALLEGSWVPPIAVGDAKANLWAFAASRTIARWGGVEIAPRISLVTGRIEGAITCNAETASEGGADIALYYAAICYGNDSDDRFEPRLAAGEIVASRALSRAGARGWAALGLRRDHSRLDIGVRRTDGSRDPDHPIVALRDTRMHLAAGLAWPLGGRLALGGEWFYAPGSVSTVRALIALTGGRR